MYWRWGESRSCSSKEQPWAETNLAYNVDASWDGLRLPRLAPEKKKKKKSFILNNETDGTPGKIPLSLPIS